MLDNIFAEATEKQNESLLDNIKKTYLEAHPEFDDVDVSIEPFYDDYYCGPSYDVYIRPKKSVSSVIISTYLTQEGLSK